MRERELGEEVGDLVNLLPGSRRKSPSTIKEKATADERGGTTGTRITGTRGANVAPRGAGTRKPMERCG